MNLNNENYKKQIVPILIYLFLSFITVSLSAIGFFRPIYGVVDITTGQVRGSFYAFGVNINDFVNYFTNSSKYINQEKKLKDQEYNIQSLQSENQLLQRENVVLRNQLGIAPQEKSKTLLALIISQSNILDYIDVNQGTNQGVKDDDVVIYKNILIGQIVDTTPNSSRVELITNKDSQVPVVVNGTSVDGIVSGGLSGLIMSDILVDENVSSGQTIVTSGLGGIFPNGLLIGTVNNVQKVTSDPFRSATINPAIDLTTLTYVFILKN